MFGIAILVFLALAATCGMIVVHIWEDLLEQVAVKYLMAILSTIATLCVFVLVAIGIAAVYFNYPV